MARRREVRRQARQAVRHGDPLAAQVAEQGERLATCERELAAVHATLHHFAERGREQVPALDATQEMPVVLSLARRQRNSA
jgi:hypothetical protein